MPEAGQRQQAVLGGDAEFSGARQLALPKHQRCLVRWGREFLGFATDHPGYTFEQTLDLYLAEVRILCCCDRSCRLRESGGLAAAQLR